jgi:hypothetical protein
MRNAMGGGTPYRRVIAPRSMAMPENVQLRASYQAISIRAIQPRM